MKPTSAENMVTFGEEQPLFKLNLKVGGQFYTFCTEIKTEAKSLAKIATFSCKRSLLKPTEQVEGQLYANIFAYILVFSDK